LGRAGPSAPCPELSYPHNATAKFNRESRNKEHGTWKFVKKNSP